MDSNPKGEPTTIDKDNVKIKTGTVNADGNCNTATTKDINLAGATATITPHNDTGPTLEITNINPGTADLAITSGPVECTVSVDTASGTLTIKYKQDSDKKCIEIEITGIDTKKDAADTETVAYGHIHAEGFGTILSH